MREVAGERDLRAACTISYSHLPVFRIGFDLATKVLSILHRYIFFIVLFCPILSKGAQNSYEYTLRVMPNMTSRLP